ncbi:MAG: hypothetical protein PVJ76_07765 [Gemmatimonadota bacterium]
MLIIVLVGFILGDWIYVAIMGGLLGFGVARLVGELKEPQRYLKVTPHELVGRILENREFWETRGKELEGTEQLMQVENLLEGLRPQGSWLRRNSHRVAKWTGLLATLVWLVFAVIMLVGGESVLGLLVPLAAASLFGVSTVWSTRAESKRQEALELLEEVREELGSKSPPLPPLNVVARRERRPAEGSQG